MYKDLKQLPYDLDRYFVKTDTCVEVPLTEIIPGEPHAVSAANLFMFEAYNGKRERRLPITLVRRGRGGYKAIDGNSTLANAIANGWSSIYAEIKQ